MLMCVKSKSTRSIPHVTLSGNLGDTILVKKWYGFS